MPIARTFATVTTLWWGHGWARIHNIATGLGYEVKAVTDSTQATDAFLELMPEVVVLDLVMPRKRTGSKC
jgi:CheY-like chemotaxis protein